MHSLKYWWKKLYRTQNWKDRLGALIKKVNVKLSEWSKIISASEIAPHRHWWHSSQSWKQNKTKQRTHKETAYEPTIPPLGSDAKKMKSPYWVSVRLCFLQQQPQQPRLGPNGDVYLSGKWMWKSSVDMEDPEFSEIDRHGKTTLTHALTLWGKLKVLPT